MSEVLNILLYITLLMIMRHEGLCHSDCLNSEDSNLTANDILDDETDKK